MFISLDSQGKDRRWKVKFTLQQATLSLTSARDGGGWSMPRPGRFTPGKDAVPIV